MKIRAHALRMIHRARCSHIGTCLSSADILAVLYGAVLRVNPADPDWPERDRFILSKGHGAAAIYAALAERGFFGIRQLESFYQNGSLLMGHVNHDVPGVDASTGSLGHGLSIACGMALAGKLDGTGYRVFALLSDGECDEGSTWEPVLFAPQHGLDNLIAIVDYNKIQSLGRVEDVLPLEPFAEKWRAFGWATRELDGHNTDELKDVLSNLPLERRKPTCIIAHTVKGKGVSFMENTVRWHYTPPNDEELRLALQELRMTE